MRQTFGWPCCSYQPSSVRAAKSHSLILCRLCYQQGRHYRMCRVGLEADDVAVTGRWNQYWHLHFISHSPKGEWEGAKCGKRRRKAKRIRILIHTVVVIVPDSEMLKSFPRCTEVYVTVYLDQLICGMVRFIITQMLTADYVIRNTHLKVEVHLERTWNSIWLSFWSKLSENCSFLIFCII